MQGLGDAHLTGARFMDVVMVVPSHQNPSLTVTASLHIINALDVNPQGRLTVQRTDEGGVWWDWVRARCKQYQQHGYN